MFEVGFSEIVLILGLALLVLGPERLPELAAKVGRWTGRARAMARQFQAQLEQEVSLEKEIKQHQQTGQSATPHYPDSSAFAPEPHSAAPDIDRSDSEPSRPPATDEPVAGSDPAPR
jgi:sec-independent protein translocase protein TatB